ncbi:hypothetical protein GA0115255_120584 [Streptomyces sp. Ncost-T6T-2b]|nr:hypothetical protein GA0115255_120584 [Streptomyces sp. Ncost-T6T-2b]
MRSATPSSSPRRAGTTPTSHGAPGRRAAAAHPRTRPLIADVLAEEAAPVRIFHDVGELESSNTHSRWLDHVLTGKGYDTLYREFAGGHDYAWWRGLFADALLWCFPARSGDGSDA